MANNNTNNLSIYYQNCRGIRTKMHTLYMNILAHSYDIIILTETWLYADILDNEYIDSRYVVFRADRDRAATGRLEGGGVLVAVLRTLCAGCAHVSIGPLPPVIDQVFIEFRLAKRNYCIGAIYIPPKQCHQIYVDYFDSLQNALLDQSKNVTNFIIVGDFNLPKLSWTIGDPYKQRVSDSDTNVIHRCIGNFMTVLSCYQINTLKNHNNHTLDLFFTNVTECRLSSVPTTLVPLDKHHPPFWVSVPIACHEKYMSRKPCSKYCFKNIDYNVINQKILSVNWNDFFLNTEIEEAISKFYEKIYSIIRENVPLKIIKSNSYPIWFTPKLILLSKKKN